MLKELRANFVLFFLLMLLTGFVYPILVLGTGQGIFQRQANGSLIEVQGRPIGSQLIGQNFVSPGYFHGRPSAAGSGYDAGNSAGSNLAPTSADLMKTVADRVEELRKDGSLYPIPVDLVTTSASGLDPDISPAAARFQAPRVAGARKLTIGAVEDLILQHTEAPALGFIGDARVNVLELNRALDAMSPSRR
ncbi:MAG: potassium-transporting ATPase subunit KdpC [Pseudomonadota bacterium]|nr:potassium-transporting ATPase subunit KdpC [Pseudomonadota bacterium]